jgi:hypothetical protein
MSAQPLASLSLISTDNKPELFARKVVVLAFTLEELASGHVTPHFLMTVICPKQKIASIADWEKTTKFRLPSGYSLIKGTREMIYSGERLDVPPGFGRYFNPQVWDTDFQIDSRHLEIVARINGLMPTASTALSEVREEGGIKLKHIKQLFDLGAYHFNLDGRESNYHCIAMELHTKKNARAKDSLALSYFTYPELKQARKIRQRYNIPLVRPSHVRFIKQMREPLTQLYRAQGIKLSYGKYVSEDWSARLQDLKSQFKGLLKQAKKGQFCAYQSTPEKTIKRVIKRSKSSRRKVKILRQLTKS